MIFLGAVLLGLGLLLGNSTLWMIGVVLVVAGIIANLAWRARPWY